MSWDYNFGATSLLSSSTGLATASDRDRAPPLELAAELSAASGSQFHSSFSSAASGSSTHRSSMATSTTAATDYEMEHKLLPHNLWGPDKKTPKLVNSAEEQRFLQSQISGADMWFASADFTQPHTQAHLQNDASTSSSSSSVFEMRISGAHPISSSFAHPHRTQVSTPATTTTTAASSTATPTPMAHYVAGSSTASSSQPMVSSAMSPSMFGLGSPVGPSPQQQQQQQQQLQQLQQTLAQQPPIAPITPAQLMSNTQNMLQSYQQQQLYLEQLQQQQQQQAQLLQSPFFLQQQAQLVSQQLQQLQLQLQIQQQQIESLNAKKLEADKLPLTEENLTKLQQSPGEAKCAAAPQLSATTTTQPSNGVAKSSHSSENKSTVNTDLYKTELCTTFQKSGSCPYGSKCQFAHGEHELKQVERGAKWRSKPCANWSKTGSCRYGNRCCFKHDS